MDSSKEASLYVSELLDHLGYSYDMIKYRQAMIAGADRLSHTRHHLRVTTGGKGEGTSLYFESDIDFMFVARDVICAANPLDFFRRRNITLFQTDKDETAPGYTTLKLLRMDGKSYKRSIASSIFISETNIAYLPSEQFSSVVNMFGQKWRVKSGVQSHAQQGPSNPGSYKHLMADSVRCFRCFCPDILRRWVSRPRSCGWPSPQDVQKISRMDSHVAPVGMKGSASTYKEWRICYTLAELHLMKNLNETQLKVYIILKKVSKSTFQPICKDITSYIMKNIVLWVSEIKGKYKFVPNTLLQRTSDCLKYFYHCLSANYLPSYMIPERNLFAGRLDIHQRQQVADLLVKFLDGDQMFLMCEKLRNGMTIINTTPRILRKFGETRDKLERLVFIKALIISMCFKPGMSLKEVEAAASHMEQYKTNNKNILKLLEVDPRELSRQGMSNRNILDVLENYVCQLLS